jgi:hypothetical protein
VVVGQCRACLGPLTYGRACRTRSDKSVVTCSPRCQQLWRLADYHLDADAYQRRRIANAKYWAATANPDVPESRKHYAARVLNGDPGPNRRYIVSGSAMTQAAEELRALRRERQSEAATTS